MTKAYEIYFGNFNAGQIGQYITVNALICSVSSVPAINPLEHFETSIFIQKVVIFSFFCLSVYSICSRLKWMIPQQTVPSCQKGAWVTCQTKQARANFCLFRDTFFFFCVGLRRAQLRVFSLPSKVLWSTDRVRLKPHHNALKKHCAKVHHLTFAYPVALWVTESKSLIINIRDVLQ